MTDVYQEWLEAEQEAREIAEIKRTADIDRARRSGYRDGHARGDAQGYSRAMTELVSPAARMAIEQISRRLVEAVATSKMVDEVKKLVDSITTRAEFELRGECRPEAGAATHLMMTVEFPRQQFYAATMLDDRAGR